MTERKEHSSVEALSVEDTLKLALEALETLDRVVLGTRRAEEAITAIKDVLSASDEQRSVSDVEPVAWQYRDFRADGFWPAWIGCDKPLPKFNGREVRALYTTPYVATPLPQRKPKFKEFIKWAGAQGYDCAQTCNSDTGEWIVLNPMTAELWKAWQAAHGIKG